MSTKKWMGMVAVLPFVAVGCGGSRAQGPTPEEVRSQAIARAEAAHLDSVGRYTERVTAGDEYRLDLALQRHASGEISDKDLIELAGQVHKKALSRINSDKAILLMEREREDAARQLIDALKNQDHQKVSELQEKLETIEHNHRRLQLEMEAKERELKTKSSLSRPDGLDGLDHSKCVSASVYSGMDLWIFPENGTATAGWFHHHKTAEWPKVPADFWTSDAYKEMAKRMIDRAEGTPDEWRYVKK